MKRYTLTPEIELVAERLRDIFAYVDNPLSSDHLTAIMGINQQGWRIVDGERWVLDYAELCWALDVAFGNNDADAS